jgi:anti-sigma factor RsiW
MPEISSREHQETSMQRPRHPASRRAALRLLALAPLVLGAPLHPTLAEQASDSQPIANETVLSTRRIGAPSSGLIWVSSSVTLAPGARWETDPDRGPLNLRVVTGELVVTLEDGAARVERRYDLFLRPEIFPFPPNVPVVLVRGDQLVVVRGYHLTIANDSGEAASAIVGRLMAPVDSAA